MKTLRPVLAMLVFLALAFLADLILDVIIPGNTGTSFNPVPYFWIAGLCQVFFAALFLLLQYLTLQKQWLSHATAIAFVVVGGLIILWTPVIVTITFKYSNLVAPYFTSRSFFSIAGLLVVVTGVGGLLPKQKKR
jgi:hypothetical protein